MRSQDGETLGLGDFGVGRGMVFMDVVFGYFGWRRITAIVKWKLKYKLLQKCEFNSLSLLQ